MAMNKDKLQKAQAEIDAVLKKYNGDLTDEALKEMIYAEAVFYGLYLNDI